MATSELTLRVITADEHLAYIQSRAASGAVSFLQVPSWGGVKAEWSSHSLGWFDGEQLVGAGLVLLRKVPRVNRYLAYLPEGPDIDWTGEHTRFGLAQWLNPLTEYLKGVGAFAVKLGPVVPIRRWHADSIKDGISGCEE